MCFYMKGAARTFADADEFDPTADIPSHDEVVDARISGILQHDEDDTNEEGDDEVVTFGDFFPEKGDDPIVTALLFGRPADAPPSAFSGVRGERRARLAREVHEDRDNSKELNHRKHVKCFFKRRATIRGHAA